MIIVQGEHHEWGHTSPNNFHPSNGDEAKFAFPTFMTLSKGFMSFRVIIIGLPHN
jgi:hypothetical protein